MMSKSMQMRSKKRRIQTLPTNALNEGVSAEMDVDMQGLETDTSKKSKVFFAVRKGRSTSSCIFLLENDFKEQIHTYTTAEYAKFGTMSEAVQYIESDPLFVVKSSRVTEKGDSNITEEATYTDGQSPKESWESMFIQLMYYHRTHSNTLVPSDCQPLYTWSIDQLKQYDQLKKGLSHTLTEGRVQLLLGLNFDFDREIPEEDKNDQSSTKVKKKKRWNKFFSELEKFKSEHGHVNVDVNSDLGKWCAKQVSHYSKYKRSSDNTLSDEQAKQLSDIGLDLMTVAEKKFYSNIDKLKKYKEEHGGYKVHSHSSLYKFINQQRRVVSMVRDIFKFQS
jgi:hypothetical protein